MKTLQIRNLRSIMLAAALVGTAGNLFGQVVKGMEVVTAIRKGDVMQSVSIAEA